MTTKQKPAHKIQYGLIAAAIWKNQSEKGGTFYNVTVSRSYRSGEELKSSDSFGRDDLLTLAKALNEAHTWIASQPRNQAESAE